MSVRAFKTADELQGMIVEQARTSPRSLAFGDDDVCFRRCLRMERQHQPANVGG